MFCVYIIIYNKYMSNQDNKNKLIVANWKMKLSLKETRQLAQRMKEVFSEFNDGEIGVCPNHLSLQEVSEILKNSPIGLGAQDVFWEEKGAFTGEVCPSMLVEAGCKYVIIGHSERRKFLMVNYEMVHKATKAVLANGKLTPIVCIGENWDERKTDRRDFVLYDQMQQALSGLSVSGRQTLVIAYEPIWAIGSGTAIEPNEAEYAHKIIRLTLNNMFGEEVVDNNFKIIYGGSINSKNASSFIDLENLDGMLVGGASLDAEEFYKVVNILCK